MGVIAKGILRGCQGLFTPVSLGYPLSVFNKNSTLKEIAPSSNLALIFELLSQTHPLYKIKFIPDSDMPSRIPKEIPFRRPI